MPQLYNMKAGVSTEADLVAAPEHVQVIAANGAAAISNGVVIITKGTACAVTLGTPTSAQNGTKITFVSATAAAHTVAAATIGFNAGDAAKDTGTFGGAIGDGFSCIAYEGEWLVLTNTNVTFA